MLKNKRLHQILTIMVWIVFIGAANAINKNFPGLVGGTLLMIGLYILAISAALKFSAWYLKKEKKNLSLINFIVWSNVIIGFLLPPLGVFISVVTFKFSNYFRDKSKKFKTLAIVGLLISIASAILGAFIMSHW